MGLIASSKRNVFVLVCTTLLLSATFIAWPLNYAETMRTALRRDAASLELQPNPAFTGSSHHLVSCGTNYSERGLAKDARAGKRTGYVLSLTYREQQTRAAANMYSLQCWAKTLLVNIVEPFLHDSRLVVPLDPSQDSMLPFSHLFSLQAWDVLTVKLGFAPLAPWRQFLAEAPRELIVVHLKYSSGMSIHERIVSGEKATHLALTDAYKEGCTQKPGFSNRLDYLAQYRFKVVREVCVNFMHGDEITLLQFNTHVLGSHHPRDVSIVMNEWRGFAPSTDSGKRVLINDACWARSTILSSLYLRPSKQVYCEAHKYREMYLRGQDYVAVIVRTEKIRTCSEMNMHECLQKTLKLLASVQKKTNLSSIFLSMDIGHYGSNSNASGFSKLDYKAEYNDFISRIYGKGVSIDLWEKSFEDTTSVRETGYIALLQKVLAAKASCLVVVGGGSFQKHTILLHRTFSKRKGQTPCVHILKSCSRNI